MTSLRTSPSPSKELDHLDLTKKDISSELKSAIMLKMKQRH